MNPHALLRKVILLLLANFLLPLTASPQRPTQATELAPSAAFDAASADALQIMRRQAEERKIGGAAVLAFFEGDKLQSWTSRMLVVGRYKDEPTDTKKGSNLLAIAYTKAAEMADTLKDSGSKVREPYTGEFGWQGGVIVPWRTGYLIAAFSGGKSEDDVAVSRAGVAAMTEPASPEPAPRPHQASGSARQ